ARSHFFPDRCFPLSTFFQTGVFCPRREFTSKEKRHEEVFCIRSPGICPNLGIRSIHRHHNARAIRCAGCLVSEQFASLGGTFAPPSSSSRSAASPASRKSDAAIVNAPKTNWGAGRLPNLLFFAGRS